MRGLSRNQIVGLYAVISTLWIVSSDWLLALVWGDFEDSLALSIGKGVSFVLLMSVALHLLLKKLNNAQTLVSAAKSDEQLLLYKLPNYFKHMPIVTYAIEVSAQRSQTVWVSDNVTKVLGYQAEQAMAIGWWSKSLHPDDKLRAQEESHRIIGAGGGHHYYRIKHKDGHYIHIHDEMHLVSGSHPQRYIGILCDISAEEGALNQVRHYSSRLENTVLGTVEAISSMVELRDPYTAGHESRVGDLAVQIAKQMQLNADTQYGLRIAGLVHDIGKISIPSEYLTKPTRLSHSEFAIIKTHAEHGYQILKSIPFPWPIAQVAYQHHERIDGSGYPQGLKGEDILLEARIIAVADVIESMATSRPYRHALGLDAALTEIETNAGKLYDPQVVNAALSLFREQGYQLSQPTN